MKAYPLDVTLDTVGNGSVLFRAHKPLIAFVVRKLTIEMDTTSSGVALLYKNGGFLTSMPVTKKMEAYGEQILYTSEYLTVEIQGGPVSTLVKFTFYYDEKEVNP